MEGLESKVGGVTVREVQILGKYASWQKALYNAPPPAPNVPSCYTCTDGACRTCSGTGSCGTICD